MGNRVLQVVVLGAGVSGLTTAITLAEAGFAVHVVADGSSSCTTSASAGASWGPYLVSHPQATEWSEKSFRVLCDLAPDKATGVRLVRGLEAAKDDIQAPDWAQALSSFRYADPAELPIDYVVGWWYEVPIIDMPIYLSYLVDRLHSAGVSIEQRRVHSLDQLCTNGVLVVNCAGVGAKELCRDEGLTATRGQLVVVENPGIETFFQDNSDEGTELTYYLPQGDHVVLGGSAIDNNTDLEPNQEIAAAIVARCARIEPRLATARVLDDRVGLRPSRKQVRVELEERSGGFVIHNYGHGGAGVTLSWGCAETVAQLAVAHGVEGHERDV